MADSKAPSASSPEPKPEGDGSASETTTRAEKPSESSAQESERSRRSSSSGKRRPARDSAKRVAKSVDAAAESDPGRPEADADQPKPAARKAEPDARSNTSGGEQADAADRRPDLPDRHIEGRPKSKEAAERALVRRKPRIGDSIPAPAPAAGAETGEGGGNDDASRGRRGRRGNSGQNADGEHGRSQRGNGAADGASDSGNAESGSSSGNTTSDGRKKRRRGGRGRGAKSGEGQGQGQGGQGRGQGNRNNQGQGNQRGKQKQANQPVQAAVDGDPVELNEEDLARRRGRQRKGKPVGRYQMCVNVQPDATQIAVLEGRHLIEHYVARPSDEVTQIHGNVYIGRVQNVLPGMEAAFVDIGTPKNAVLYRGDVHYDAEDVESAGPPRIEEMLKARQTIICQVTKNPIAHKGARLTQEVSLPGRFVVLIPNSNTYGISKRLPDPERKRLRDILDRAKPDGHGIIVRTAAEGVTDEEIIRDIQRLSGQWDQIEALAKNSKAPALLYREPDLALRVIREEFNKEYRGIVIDDQNLYTEVADYVRTISPALTDRVSHYDVTNEKLSLFERHHVHEQLHKALDRKVWLPSGGSLIIEHTEALTVIDVNTGKNVGNKSLEDTVLHNNLEAAEEVARQLRLRDIGGIIVIDFVDMEVKANREKVIRVFRDSLARDKTRTQVFDISELGLVEMTRKRIGEGLLESLSEGCPECAGRGVVFDAKLLGEAPVQGG